MGVVAGRRWRRDRQGEGNRVARSGLAVDPDTGEVSPLVIVTDNGPAMKSVAVAKWFAAQPGIVHVRTRHKSPHTNGVIEGSADFINHVFGSTAKENRNRFRFGASRDEGHV